MLTTRKLDTESGMQTMNDRKTARTHQVEKKPRTLTTAPVKKEPVPTPPKPSTTVSISGGGGGGTISAPKTSTSTTKTTSGEDDIRKKYENQINNEISMYEKQMNDEIARLREQGSAAIGRNNEYLEQQLSQLQEQKAIGDQQAMNLENRRGGFYSGGLDYRLAQNDRATQQATGNLQSEIGGRNAEIENSNNLVAQQAMDQVSMLRQQAPDRVRELVDQALERQYAREFQERQFAFQQQQARASAARAAASQRLAAQRAQQAQAQQQWENQFKQKQFDWQTSQGGGETGGPAITDRDIEVFSSQFGDVSNSDPTAIRSFVNQQYADGRLTEEEADILERSMISQIRQPEPPKPKQPFDSPLYKWGTL